MKCCICGRELPKGYFGNNPDGAVDTNKQIIKWDVEDKCCDECNKQFVLPGRMYKFYKVIPPTCLVERKG